MDELALLDLLVALASVLSANSPPSPSSSCAQQTSSDGSMPISCLPPPSFPTMMPFGGENAGGGAMGIHQQQKSAKNNESLEMELFPRDQLCLLCHFVVEAYAKRAREVGLEQFRLERMMECELHSSSPNTSDTREARRCAERVSHAPLQRLLTSSSTDELCTSTTYTAAGQQPLCRPGQLATALNELRGGVEEGATESPMGRRPALSLSDFVQRHLHIPELVTGPPITVPLALATPPPLIDATTPSPTSSTPSDENVDVEASTFAATEELEQMGGSEVGKESTTTNKKAEAIATKSAAAEDVVETTTKTSEAEATAAEKQPKIVFDQDLKMTPTPTATTPSAGSQPTLSDAPAIGVEAVTVTSTTSATTKGTFTNTLSPSTTLSSTISATSTSLTSSSPNPTTKQAVAAATNSHLRDSLTTPIVTPQSSSGQQKPPQLHERPTMLTNDKVEHVSSSSPATTNQMPTSMSTMKKAAMAN